MTFSDDWREEPTRAYAIPRDVHIVEDGKLFIGVIEAPTQEDADRAARKYLEQRALLTEGQK